MTNTFPDHLTPEENRVIKAMRSGRKVVIEELDPLEEWREAREAFTRGFETFPPLPDYNAMVVAGLQAAVKHTPPFKEAVELLRRFLRLDLYQDEVRAFLAAYGSKMDG